MRKALQLLISCGVMLQAGAYAQTPDDENLKSPVDSEIRLPSYPKSGNLIPFDPGVRSSSRYFVDPGSVSTVGDGVARYTLVVVGAGGVQNVSYEGISCRTLEHRYYAFGRSDGSWSSVRSSEWRPIGNEDTNLRRVLYWNYFCPDRTYGGSALDAINRLKNGVPFRELRSE